MLASSVEQSLQFLEIIEGEQNLPSQICLYVIRMISGWLFLRNSTQEKLNTKQKLPFHKRHLCI